MRHLFAGAWPVCRKEFTHILRDKGTLFFALVIPVMQLLFFGFAIDTNIRQIPTALLDEARTQESRRIIDSFLNTDAFNIQKTVSTEAELTELMRAGVVRAGIRVPLDLSRKLRQGQPASVLVLVDGSDSQIASFAVNVSTGVMLQDSLKRAGVSGALPLEVRPSVLYNPAARSPNFFVPGMIGIVLQAMIIVLVALSIVRERERGTLEQLSLTPVSPLGLMVGKMLPYGALGFAELCAILTIMRVVFDVPIHGSVVLLLVLSLPFFLTILGLGLLISTKAKTQAEAFQMAMGTLLPSVFLSGYIFLIQNMPWVFQGISHVIPATYFIAILRGIILRGASFQQVWVDAAVLLLMGCVTIGLAARQIVRNRAQ